MSEKFSGSPVLTLRSLAVGYDKIPLHSGITLSVRRGEIVSLIGPNGSGKSTILRSLTRQLEAVDGAVFVGGRDMDSLTQKELSRRMSVLLTGHIRTELMTCRDVVSRGRYPHTGCFGRLTAEDEKAVDEAISLVRAEDFADKDFMRVSDGQRQRILLARALCQSPKILVLDEPTSYLDIKWRLEMLSVLRKLAADGVAVIASLHEIDLALRISDRILCVGSKVSFLDADADGCMAQIKSLYGLADDFFESEPGYASLVRSFCSRTGADGGRAGEKMGAGGGERAASASRRCHPLMIQGTMSGAGKSLVTAGLCRILAQDGFSVAPFKSQNMALNSFVTDEGLEMGRAQVMQAEAAGVEPSVLMNPVLLKPTGDAASQVIVGGEVVGDMSAREYFAYKKSLVPEIERAYRTLAAGHDIIVIEGAGSPAEINLKENDIVNMGMARLSDSPVLLVADIDRGGVFAQLIGTVELLEADERSRVKGLVINKFRGDESILADGIRMIEEKTGIPVVGTVPYMRITLDDEDSLSENLHTVTRFRNKKDEIQLAVVRLPHISNFTDFIPLASHTIVNLYYVEKPEDLGNPDAVILPGTKNTLFDLGWLMESGIAERIQDEARKGTLIAGICGGFQMLGERIIGVESGMEAAGGRTCVSALGLLPVETEFSVRKTRARVFGEVCAESPFGGLPVAGYEIHMGRTRFADGAEALHFARLTDSVSGETKMDGAARGNVFGTYIHGLFDSGEFTGQFVKILAERKGISLPESQILNDGAENPRSLHEFKESQYNLLADTLRAHLDMKRIYEIIGVTPR